ncbi:MULTISPECIES: hypothetical protein [unclassified Streptomyces]|uniref:hypothetical protein n=1 Tax=unclassified Streptomyces TaxID=2593676 RepID=UPI001E560826|nr:hypothetical protein [Streptomyces sp. CB02980]MCB8908360.1 hypothetical protein [Streptomyces sp. CB02980]
MTGQMTDGRRAGTDRRRRRVQDAIAAALRDGTPLTASAVARAARVDRTFLYRHRDLLEELHTSSTRPADTPPGTGPTVTPESLQADLANANARATRLATRVQQLEAHLSRQLGARAWTESGLGAPVDIAELQSNNTSLEQHNVELKQRLAEIEEELDAARAANRDLTRALNQRQ